MSLQATESRPTSLFFWSPPKGLSGLKFLDEQQNSGFCSICQDDAPNREGIQEGLLLTGCCNQIVDMRCLESWKNRPRENHDTDLSLSCTNCRASLDDRIFYRITKEDHQHSKTLRELLDQRQYSNFREDLTNSEPGPFTHQSVVRHAAFRNDIVALSILNNRELLSQADQESPGFYQTALFTAALYNSTKAAAFLLNRGANPDGTISGRPLNMAMAMGNLPLVDYLNKKSVRYLEDDRGITPLTALYLGKIARFGSWKTLRGEKREELEDNLVKLCLNHNVDLSKTIPHPIRPERKATALHLAALAGSFRSFKNIVERSPSNLIDISPFQGLVENLLGGNSDRSEIDPPIFDTLNAQDGRKFQFMLEKMPQLDDDEKAVRRGAPDFETLLNEALKMELKSEGVSQTKPNHKMTHALLDKGHDPSRQDRVHGSAFHVFASHCANYSYKKDPNAGFFSFGNKECSYFEQHQLLQKMKQKTEGFMAFPHLENGATPLHSFVKTHRGDYYSEETVKALSKFEVMGLSFTLAKVGDNNGNTPLHDAVRLYYEGRDNKKLIQDLILVGADPNIKNKEGVSSKEICKSNSKGNVLREVFTQSQTYPSISFQEQFEIVGDIQRTTVRQLKSEDPDYQRGFWRSLFGNS